MKKIILIILLVAPLSNSNYLFAQKKVETCRYLGFCISSVFGDDNHAEESNSVIKASGLDLDFPMSKDSKIKLIKRN